MTARWNLRRRIDAIEQQIDEQFLKLVAVAVNDDRQRGGTPLQVDSNVPASRANERQDVFDQVDQRHFARLTRTHGFVATRAERQEAL